MIVIGICNKHQSVGKTEITSAIAHGLVNRNKLVAVVCDDDDNTTNRMRAYCATEYPRGFDCFTLDELPADVNKYDYVLIDTGRGISDDGLKFLSENAHYVIFPIGRDRKTFDEGVKPVKEKLNGCAKAFVINDHVTPAEDEDGEWTDKMIKATANGAGAKILYTWPDLQAGAIITKTGQSPRYAHNVPGIDRYRHEIEKIADQVLRWAI